MKKKNVFKSMAMFITKYYWQIIVSALIFTVICFSLAEKLRLDMTWLSMAPQKSESVIQYKNILKKFGSANPIIVTIKGENPEELKKIVKELSFMYKKSKDIKDINYRINMGFIEKYGLLLQKSKDLKRIKTIVKDFNLSGFFHNLNNNFEKEYIEESEEALIKQEKDAISSMDALKDILYGFKGFIQDKKDSKRDLIYSFNKFTYGDEYFLSRDKGMIMLFIQPKVSIIDIAKIVPVVKTNENVLNKFREKYSHLKFGQTGISVISRDEMDTGMNDTKFNLITAVIAILLLLSISFRMLAAPFLSLAALILGVIWDLGIIYLVIGRLNLMTAMVGVILIGLGIDYAIHLLTGYTQNRHKGLSQKDALVSTYEKTGPGLLTGALTTAVAFLVFMISDVDVMKELGFAMGIGIICTYIVSIIVLPALIIAKEKIQKKFKFGKQKKNISMEYKFLGKMGSKIGKYSILIISIAVLLTAVSIIVIPKLHFISDMRKLEAKNLLSLDLIDEINDRYDLSPDPVHIITDSIKEADDLTVKLEKYNSVGFVDSITHYLPSKDKQKRRLPLINNIKSILLSQPQIKGVDKDEFTKEIRRFEQNIIEIGDMAYMNGLDKLVKRCDELVNLKDNKKQGKNIFDDLIEMVKNTSSSKINALQNIFADRLKRNFLLMCNSKSISLKDIPENVKKLFISNDGKNYLINVYSATSIWKDLFSSTFLKDVRNTTSRLTGAPIFMYDVIKYSSRGGKQATILALIAIFLILLIDFRSFKYTFIALIPLILGSIWILGFLVFSNIYFTWMTVMIIPLIIGIGIDDGVHIIHRYRIEGPGSCGTVLRTTGKAVMLTSLTTMIAFGSLFFSKMVGYQQFGISLFVGIGILFILSVVLLPVILTLIEKRK